MGIHPLCRIDFSPKKSVDSVNGIGDAAGGLGGVLVLLLAGGLEDKYRIMGIMEASKAGLIKATQALPLEKVKIDNLKEVMVDPTNTAMFEQARHMISSNISVAYGIMFTTCALAYLIAWAIMKTLVPKHTVITDL